MRLFEAYCAHLAPWYAFVHYSSNDNPQTLIPQRRGKLRVLSFGVGDGVVAAVVAYTTVATAAHIL